MNKREANYEAWRYGDDDFVYPGENDGEKVQFKYPDDGQKSGLSAELRLNERIIDAYELESVRSALQLAHNIDGVVNELLSLRMALPIAKKRGPIASRILMRALRGKWKRAGLYPWPQDAHRHSFISYR